MDICEFRDCVQREKKRQVKSGKVHKHDDPRWYLILSEEVGEVADAILRNEFLEGDYRLNILDELVQCAAVIEAWVEQRDFTGE